MALLLYPVNSRRRSPWPDQAEVTVSAHSIGQHRFTCRLERCCHHQTEEDLVGGCAMKLGSRSCRNMAPSAI